MEPNIFTSLIFFTQIDDIAFEVYTVLTDLFVKLDGK